MTPKATDKFCFRGIWYPTSFVRVEACKAYELPEADFQTDDRLQELVEAIVKGPTSKSANFLVALHERRVK